MRSTRRSAMVRCCELLGLALMAGAPQLMHATSPSPDEDANAVLSAQQIEELLKGTAAPSSTRGLIRHQKPPAASISLNIAFEYNSFALKPQASEQLKQLSSALTSQSLRSDRFMVAGHTDAKGNPQFNQRLSLQRAQSVKRFLVANGVAGARLDTVGYGAQQLLNPEQPDDARNRRVEIRDLGAAP
jgi:outer membrane protein OmpA-like peptidoglycan-associated protein